MDFKLFSFDDEIEQQDVKITSAKMFKSQERIKTKLFLNKEKAKQIFTEIPQPGESYHMVSNGVFDYFNLIPIAIEYLGNKTGDFYFSTWTLNNRIAEDILKLYDDGKVKSITGLVGLYFKSRETAVFNMLYEGLKKRGQKMFCNENHSKVTLIENGKDYLVIEGSANFTANPRIEQFVITNSKELFMFHKSWMDEIVK
jgi:hypothetical protein